jgi:hypothetical protein
MIEIAAYHHIRTELQHAADHRHVAIHRASNRDRAVQDVQRAGHPRARLKNRAPAWRGRP